MMNVIKVVVSLVAVAILCILQNIINAKKINRVRQFAMIPIALLEMVGGIFLVLRFQELTQYITKLSDFFDNSDILLMNIVLPVGWIISKLFWGLLFMLIGKKKRAMEVFSMGFYWYDEDYDTWFLYKKWVGFRKFLFGLVIGLCVACGVFLGLSWILGSESILWKTIFPCAVLVVIVEFYSFVNGETKDEFEHSVHGDEDDARRISNYYKLRETLEKVLPEPLLSAHTGCEFISRETPADLIKQLHKSDAFEDRITAEYFDSNDRYVSADIDSVKATLNMMHGRNILFFNPFYKDIGVYILLPLARDLLSGKKCLVLCGRKNSAEDVRNWLTELLVQYTHMDSLWQVGILSDVDSNYEVGILTFTEIYDKQLINNNSSFLSQVGFVLMIEPSIMLSTAQIALSIVTETIRSEGEKPVYCVCDRYTDGLVDTLSHLIHDEITNVVAMPVPRCNYTAMIWDADGDFCRQNLFDKQTRYLGNGTELAAIAIKNQIPEVTWYGETKVPIRDIRWIAGQHYDTICRYMNQPIQQENLYRKIHFIASIWSSSRTKEQFVIAEDEFCNMFNLMRAYLSRAERQIFVNVLSENYLLRDYMRCNRQMFLSNPNSIPSCVPDYAKTERNTLIKLIIMMTLRPVSEEEIIRELHLVGIETTEAYLVLLELLKKYTFAEETLISVIGQKSEFDELTHASLSYYSITDAEFDKYFSDSLKSAYYIVEDEVDESEYIDAKLFTHVTQTVLPGQLMTYDGKYYLVKYVAPQSGVVLRRASDLFDSRRYYRQIREYLIDSSQSYEIVSVRTVMDIEFSEIRTDVFVKTTGYLDMPHNHDLRKARLINLSEDPFVSYYNRKYHNKSILRIKLPEADDKICFTICLMLGEVFRSIFPDGAAYLAAVCKRPDNIDGMLNYVVYPASGNVEDGYIYIIEDSDIDLGFLGAIEKNFMKIMEIIADFLDWHSEKMRESASNDPIPERVARLERDEIRHRSFLVKMFDRIRKLFGGKDEPKARDVVEETKESNEQEVVPTESEKPEEPSTPAEVFDENGSEEQQAVSPVAAEAESELSDETSDISPFEEQTSIDELHPEDEFETSKTEDPDLVHIDGTDIFETEGTPEESDYFNLAFERLGLLPLTKSRYQKNCYLKYGFDEIDSRIQVEELKQYLRVRGWCNNTLTQARKHNPFSIPSEQDIVNRCDFCAMPLNGVSYELLNDGRIRCNDCAASAISTAEEFKELFFRCLELLEDFYGIRMKAPISVKMTDAREVSKRAGVIFKPSKDYADRILGFAQRKHGKFFLIVENGSPRLAAIETVVHELTHIWQYLNWDDAEVNRQFGMAEKSCSNIARDILYEGMAVWTSIQYLYLIGEIYYATQLEAYNESRNDVYGVGFCIYRDHYPLQKDSEVLKYSPFTSFPPIEPSVVKDAIKASCNNPKCIC